MRKPTIHLNGSSPESLAESYLAAYYAITAAEEKLNETSPNGRDYYPQEENANAEARAEHFARCEKLREVREELEALAMHCQDAADERARVREARQ